MIILALMAVARLFTWYVLRLGRRQIDAHAAEGGMSVRKLGWEMAWKPVLMLIVMIYAIGADPIGYMWWDELRTIDKLPVVTVADGTDAVDQYRRVEGDVPPNRCTGHRAAPAAAATTTREPVCWLIFRPAARRCCWPSHCRCPTSSA